MSQRLSSSVSRGGPDPQLHVERSLAALGRRFVAGVDEVGRGALAGPVSVGMVLIDLDTQTHLEGVKDSKLLSPAKRTALVPAIRQWAVASAVGHASAQEIDDQGLNCALGLAGRRAWATLNAQGCVVDAVLLDGAYDWFSVPGDTGTREHAVLPVLPRIKADRECLSVAAASVLAKVERDGILQTLDRDFPQYGWKNNKGYGTKEHRRAVALTGPSPWHRMSWHLTN